ncbi:hypothetical protein M378DRAFT_574681 [Amanita muscaria Koide BX008]|uniref:Carboxypeptidase n=1 Tax=Amanita muscaria (strain Koide BX008) TaxID=946122 RepID=A0A0C2TD77_AMAMK|nr:hypothetical protein M378DRAFT_574681 [Amanita muscaria Koide BX008]
MRVLLLVLAVAVSFSTARAGQIPVVGSVLGGVPSTPYLSLPTRLEIAASVNVGGLRIVENSGICETTPGIYQASGYADLTSTKSLWFWYFAARNNPDTAPLALWFNGGPGSSSMIGLFQEHGPCRITNDSSSVVNNTWSWNNQANMLYIDQPVGVGFSYGNLTVSTSKQAAEDVWTFMQIFLKDSKFSNLQNRPLAIWTESYGGHYGPAFAAYFLSQNSAIDAGKASGIKLNLKVLGIGNGLTNPLVQYPGYITYAGTNPYHPLVNSSIIESAQMAWNQSGGCMDLINTCYNGGSASACSRAQSFCNARILAPLHGNWDVYYVPTAIPDPYPPDFTKYINSIAPTIGANVTWQLTNVYVYSNFAATGDWMSNSAPDLETVINAGVRTIIYDGDADYILNFYGVEAMVDNLTTTYSSSYRQQQFAPYTVDGQAAGLFKTAGQFSYIRFYGAGHEVPAYQYGTLQHGQAAVQMFTQFMMSNRALVSTVDVRLLMMSIIVLSLST